MRDVKLEDVDGTVKGRAALVMIDLEDPWGAKAAPSLMRSDFEEGEDGGYGPVAACWALWEGTKADWPHHTAAVVANERAQYLDWVSKMEEIGITGNTPEQYVQCATEPLL